MGIKLKILGLQDHWEASSHPYEAREIEACLIPYIKILLKLIEELNVKSKTIKHLEENTGVNLHDFRLSNGFVDMTPILVNLTIKRQVTQFKNMQRQLGLLAVTAEGLGSIPDLGTKIPQATAVPNKK